jgi:hypothetical protein
MKNIYSNIILIFSIYFLKTMFGNNLEVNNEMLAMQVQELTKS